ncbi:MAG: hypothetical protein Q7K54_04550 [Candidatus Parcubacteria bacterium]|nr:hypothetical protein [Candidatus Parcubacteria bacterium]
MCGSVSEIKLCTGDGVQSTSCALYPYRFGRRPQGGNKRVLSDAQRQAMSERMKKNLEKMKMAKEAKSAVTDPV